MRVTGCYIGHAQHVLQTLSQPRGHEESGYWTWVLGEERRLAKETRTKGKTPSVGTV